MIVWRPGDIIGLAVVGLFVGGILLVVLIDFAVKRIRRLRGDEPRKPDPLDEEISRMLASRMTTSAGMEALIKLTRRAHRRATTAMVVACAVTLAWFLNEVTGG